MGPQNNLLHLNLEGFRFLEFLPKMCLTSIPRFSASLSSEESDTRSSLYLELVWSKLHYGSMADMF